MGLVMRITGLWDRVRRTTPGRAWTRYSTARGNLLAGGVTYFAFLSLFPALALAFTVFGILLRGDTALLVEVRTYLSSLLPGFIRNGDSGLIAVEAPAGNTLSFTGSLGLVGLLWTGLGWIGAMRDGLRAVLDVPGEPGNAVLTKLRDVQALMAFGVAILMSAIVTAVAGTAAGWLADVVGLGGVGWLLTVAGYLVGAVLDGLIVLGMIRLLGGADLGARALRAGAVVGGLGLTGIKALGTTLLTAMNNPVYASIAVVVGLLAWLNLMSRVVLFAGAYAGSVQDAVRPAERAGQG